MDIVVLAGGLSTERDVSLASGGQIANSLQENGHRVLLIDVYCGIPEFDSFENLHEKYKKDDYSYKIPSTPPDLEALKREYGNELVGSNVIEVCKMVDVVFIGLHGGIGENGQLQVMLDIYDIAYTGSGHVGSLLAMDKSLSKELMMHHGVPTAEYEIVSSWNEVKMARPFVVKPIYGGSSVGIEIVKGDDEKRPPLLRGGAEQSEAEGFAFSTLKSNPSVTPTACHLPLTGEADRFLVEKYIEGREFSVGVLDGMALPAIEIVPKNSDWFDFSSKYQGTTDEICPADIPQEWEMKMREYALKVHEILRLECYSRTDFIIAKDGNIYCLEANSLPGFTANSLLPQEAKVAGISYNELCEKVIELALGKRGKYHENR